MAKVLMYLLESSILLTLFYCVYRLVFSRETFFSLNRFYLLTSVVAALLIPLLSLDLRPKKVSALDSPIEQLSKLRTSYYDAVDAWEFDVRRGGQAPHRDTKIVPAHFYYDLVLLTILFVYAVGVVVCLLRNVQTMLWIRRMISSLPNVSGNRLTIVKIPEGIAPFSFFRHVFVHDEMIDSPDFDQFLAHEKTHIEQRHSIDLVFVQIVAMFFWFNPVMWYLIKSLKTTHEYIADKKIIASGYSMVEYQALLLKQLISNNSHGLVHNFNLSFIKKRIAMMKNRRSGWLGKIKVSLAIVGALIVSAVVIQCNTKLDDDALKSGNANGSENNTALNLPVLPKTGYHFNGDPNNGLVFAIEGDKLTIDGKVYQVDQISSVIQNKGLSTETGFIEMHVDKNQKMGLVRDVEFELRKADRRKLIYVGVAIDGSKVETPILLPPTPDDARRLGIFVESDLTKAETDGRTAILKFKAENTAGRENQEKVHSFVKEHLDKSSTDYVVSLKYDDNDTYESFLRNLHFIREGYIQIYQERSQALFGKDYYDVSKEEYQVVRKNAPMAISIAEGDEI